MRTMTVGAAAAERFLAGLVSGERVPATDIAIVVAHPDDETIGAGAQLPRLEGVSIIHVTDGAPRNLQDARTHGFSTASGYAEARRRELEAAMGTAGLPNNALLTLGVPDQEASLNLVPLAERLAQLFLERGTNLVLTHAYEGGHPDHDATAFACDAACRLIARDAPDRRPTVVEMPFYYAGSAGRIIQTFLTDSDEPAWAVWLSDEERALKERMIAAFATQRQVLAQFPAEVERFRVARSRDFRDLPQVEILLYEQQNWGMTGSRWQSLVRAALEELGQGATP